MKVNFHVLFLVPLLSSCAAFGFVATEDFSLVDDRGGSHGIDIDVHSALTLRHGFVEHGRYRIPVDGNRHFLTRYQRGREGLDPKIEADAPYSVVSRTADRLELRTETAKDSAQFFRFQKP